MIGKNNPFNIRYLSGNRWLGQTGSKDGFCEFSTLQYGVRAAAIIVMRTYRKRNILTISDIINAWAPPIENKTDSYIDFVCKKFVFLPSVIPNRDDFPLLLHAMSIFEGNPVSYSFVLHVLDKFHIAPYNCK